MIRTGCFFTYSGPGRISIARSVPRNIAAGYRVYRPLAPGPWFRSVSWERYEELYGAQLSTLDPRKVCDDLYQLAGTHDPILLCWERVDLSERCHRQLAAAWLQAFLGMEVLELSVNRGSETDGSVNELHGHKGQADTENFSRGTL